MITAGEDTDFSPDIRGIRLTACYSIVGRYIFLARVISVCYFLMSSCTILWSSVEFSSLYFCKCDQICLDFLSVLYAENVDFVYDNQYV